MPLLTLHRHPFPRAALLAALVATSLGLTASPALAAPLVQAPPPPPLEAPRDEAWPGVIGLTVDATDLQRRILRVTQTLPVARPGQRLTLLYPRFLPGAHGPYGRVEQLGGLRISGQGRPLPWTRDTLDTHAFHVDVPADVTQLTLNFQHLSPAKGGGDRITMTRRLLGIEWETTLLYPAGHHVSAIRVRPTLKLPAGWQQASALPSREGGQRPALAAADGTVAYGEVSVETLVDSPLFAGPNVRRVALDAPDTPQPVVLNIVADEASQLEATPAQLDAHRALVTQSVKLFGSRPWRRYDFLLALSDEFGGIGLEHHESSENGLRPDYFQDWDKAIRGRELLPHEFVHAWNGKLKRPEDLWTASYNVPMRNSLLWVYEGLTEYYGHVLTARAGLSTPEQARDRLARVAAWNQRLPGHEWRSLQDTTNDPRLGPGISRDWSDWQRELDYYDEGLLLWLEVDTLIREKSGGARSLDDFALAFFGQPVARRADGSAIPQTYSFDDLVAALGAVQAHDWAGFLRGRLDRVGSGGPLDGLARGGWQLVWRDTEGDFQPNERGWSGDSGTERPAEFTHSLGLSLLADGSVEQVLWGSPAFEAGMVPGSSVLAVGGLAYKHERLDAALRANTGGQKPIVLLVKDGEVYRQLSLDWRGGPRHPALERLPGVADRLSAIYAPR